MLRKLNIVWLITVLVAGCSSGSTTPSKTAASDSDIQVQLMGTIPVQTVVGSMRTVTLLMSTQTPYEYHNIQFNNLSQVIAGNPGWSIPGNFNCQKIDNKHSCILNLTFTPTAITDNGSLNLHYTYSKDYSSNSLDVIQINKSNVIVPASTDASGDTTVDYSSTTANNVNANISPSIPVEELEGLSQDVIIGFHPDDDESATNLVITSDMSKVYASNTGWSGPSNFSCTNVASACNLDLTFAPTSSSSSGTLILDYSYTNSAGVSVNESVAIAYLPLAWSSNYTAGSLQYMTASTVEALNQNLSGIYPVVESSLSLYLGVDSALGYFGPLSSFGPLGPLGPLGTDLWNPVTYWISGAYSWANYFPMINGPLSDAGPLGQNGPYTTSSYYNGSVFSTNQFAANTRAFGLWSILGPIGPLGAVGPLGALGPIGATGLTRVESTGEMINGSNQVVHQISVPYDSSTSRTFNVYNNYVQSYTEQMTDNGTSFMVEGNLGANSSNSYTINNAENQIVTVLAVPNSTVDSDIIYIGVYDTSGNLLALSNSDLYINYVEFTAIANTSYVVKITKAATSLSGEYNLYVTGSYDYLNEYYITGSYIQTN